MSKPQIPYSHSFDESLGNMIFHVNEMLKEHVSDFPNLKSVELLGMTEEKNNCVDFRVELKDGTTKTCSVVRHVDESALEITEGFLIAHYGLNKKDAKEAIEYANEKDIESLDIGLYNQLCSDYIYRCLPHNDGGEFLEQDKEMILDLITETEEFHN